MEKESIKDLKIKLFALLQKSDNLSDSDSYLLSVLYEDDDIADLTEKAWKDPNTKFIQK